MVAGHSVELEAMACLRVKEIFMKEPQVELEGLRTLLKL